MVGNPKIRLKVLQTLQLSNNADNMNNTHLGSFEPQQEQAQ
jgi:hypothetical protein